MPMYDYVCARCAKQFEEFVSLNGPTPACPTCTQCDEVTRIPLARVLVGKKEDLRPPFIKGVRPPRR